MSHNTPDLNQAAFLWVQDGVTFDGVYRVGRKVFFKFETDLTSQDLQKLLLDYSNGTTLVEPKSFCAAQFELRGWLHNSRDAREDT